MTDKKKSIEKEEGKGKRITDDKRPIINRKGKKEDKQTTNG